MSVDISETSIADDIRTRGYVRIGDTWHVRMLVTEKRIPTGYRNEYKVTEVLNFEPALQQSTLPFTSDDDDDANEETRVPSV